MPLLNQTIVLNLLGWFLLSCLSCLKYKRIRIAVKIHAKQLAKYRPE